MSKENAIRMASRVQNESRTVAWAKRKVYYISMVGTDANNANGTGIPRNVHNFFDVKSNSELVHYGVNFLSAQDLVSFQKPKAASRKRKINIYQLVSLLFGIIETICFSWTRSHF